MIFSLGNEFFFERKLMSNLILFLFNFFHMIFFREFQSMAFITYGVHHFFHMILNAISTLILTRYVYGLGFGSD